MSKSKMKKWDVKHIICVVLTVFALFAVVAFLANSFGSDTRDISASKFSVGGLDANGEYVEQKNTIFTEELIECQGLEITPDFKSNVSYQVFLYGSDKEFMQATDKLTGNYKLNNSKAQYCRIMILPEDFAKKDFEINFFECYQYANELTITVNRKQNFVLRDYFVADEENENKVANAASAELAYIAKEGYGVSKPINCEGIDSFDIRFTGTTQPDDIEVLFYTVSEDGATYTFVSSEVVSGDEMAASVAVAEGATHMVVNYRLGERFVINQSN